MTLNQGFLYRERIQRGGPTVLEHFVRHHPHSTEAQWRERIAGGEVALDGAIPLPGTLLGPGQELTWQRPPWEEPEVELSAPVLYEDGHFLAVHKPGGLPTLPGGGFLENTLLALVRREHPQDPFPCSPMHRLGRGTSGIVLFARTAEAAAAVQTAWREHRVEKRYRALGSGVATADTFEIRAPIGPVPHPWLGSIFAASPAGKRSLSHATVLERRPGATLFQLDIETGRPHQIRIHLAWAGHPLVGDPLYGPGGLPLEGIVALPGDLGYWLHAERLAFTHPFTGRPLVIQAPPPPCLMGPAD
jgi:23S rRNA pseudouridine1911/1915/1917 synthase